MKGKRPFLSPPANKTTKVLIRLLHREEWVYAKDRNKPVIKFGLNGHALEAGNRENGKWYRAADWLSNGAGFPEEDWGSADSPPNAFQAGKWRDACWIA